MEAIAQHDFTARSDDELSFSKGGKLKVINMEEDRNWYTAEYEDNEGWIPCNYIELEPNPWYIPRITREDAENILMERQGGGRHLHIQKDGAFLVRLSKSSPGNFALSVKFCDKVHHFKVRRDGPGKYCINCVKFDSLNELVKYHRTASINRSGTVYLQDLINTVYQQDLIRPRLVCNLDFKPRGKEELELKRGNIVTVLSKKDRDWLLGEIQRHGRTEKGLFPKTCVIPYSDFINDEMQLLVYPTHQKISSLSEN